MNWWDQQKHALVAQIATAMENKDTIGPNIWQAVREMGQNVGVGTDSGDAKQNSRNAMMGFGVGSIHSLGAPKVPIRPPSYPVAEVPPEQAGAGLTPEQQGLIQAFLARQAAAAKVIPFPSERAAANSTWDKKSNLAEAQWSVGLMEPVIKSGKASATQVNMYNNALQKLKAAQADLSLE